jgi:hypothetical protein
MKRQNNCHLSSKKVLCGLLHAHAKGAVGITPPMFLLLSVVNTLLCITSQAKNLLLGLVKDFQTVGGEKCVIDPRNSHSYAEEIMYFPLAVHFQV